MSMRSIGAKIARLANAGFDVQIGPHTEALQGFYALVYRSRDLPVCDECETPCAITWDMCGHGHSVTQALENAEAVAKTGRPLKSYDGEDFYEACDDEPVAPTPTEPNMSEQRLPRVSVEVIETIGATQGQMDMEKALARFSVENPQIVMILSGLPTATPVMAGALAYELLHKQADVDWSNENLGGDSEQPFLQDRLRPWTVRVLPDEGDGEAEDIRVFAIESTDARIVAFAMSGGFARPAAVSEMGAHDYTVVELYTEIIE
jgi:hypothetical protein